MAVELHQNETCERIIQHLEMRAGAKRSDVRVRDRGNHTSPGARVEMTFWLGDQFYALEHTGIEPFDGFMEHQKRGNRNAGSCAPPARPRRYHRCAGRVSLDCARSR
jgi:hypothetical protein